MQKHPLTLACISSCVTYALLINAHIVQAETHHINSLDGKTKVSLSCSEAELRYSFSWQGKSLVAPSIISLIDQSSYSVMGIVTKQVEETWEPVWGSYREVQDRCNQLILKLDASGIRIDLICRVYDDGIGLRFSVPAQAALSNKRLKYHFECKMTGDFSAYAPNGERDPFGPVRLSKLGERRLRPNTVPVVMDSGVGEWLALLESDLYSAEHFTPVKFTVPQASQTISTETKATGSDQAFVTPWRVILFGNSPGDLLNSSVPLNLAAPCKLQHTDWIKSGRGLWDWRIHGYDNGEFVYGIDTQSYLRIIDFAAEFGIEYFTIDDRWFSVGDNGELITNPAVDLPRVIEYAKEKGVAVILYYDRKQARDKALIGDKALFAYFKSLGAAGLKYGFMGSNTHFTRGAIEGSAAEQLLIFFHDGPVPMTGVERTLPNMITREFCHAQQDSRRAFSPTGFLKMAMVNALAGPLDQANGNFGLTSINAGERKKGPRKKNSYVSTVVSEVARCLVISSGLITLPDAPEEYRKKADLFEFLRQMPATWDETRVINSKMGEFITTARRTGDTWFVASVNNETPRELNVPLDFLRSSSLYEATLFQDAEDSHGVKNPEAYEIARKQFTVADVVTARMVHGGGHAMILRPIKAAK